MENVRNLDLLPQPMLQRMMQYGIAIDRDHFRELSRRLDEEMRILEAEICSYIPPEKLQEFISRSNLSSEDDYLPMNVDSGAQLARLFFDVMGIGSGRELKQTKSGNRISTGKKQLEQLKRGNPVVQKTLDYRERAKLKSTYTDALPQLAREHLAGTCWCGLKHWDTTYRIHSEFLSTRTDTGRFASKNPNLQNIPVRTELGRLIRAGFIPSPGCRLVGVDFSQEEMRIGAHLSRDRNLIRIFNEGLDPHEETARIVFKIPADQKPDKLSQRDPARHLNFGIFYGLTPMGLQDQLGVTYATAGTELPEWITEEWCAELIADWYSGYSGVVDYIDQQRYRARRYGIVWTMMGRVRRVPEVRSVHRWIREAGLRQAGNAPIQGTGADWMRLVMGKLEPVFLELLNLGVWVWPLLTIHDELMVEVEELYAEYVRDRMIDAFESVLTDEDTGECVFRVPIKAEGKMMDYWKKGN